jgi:hypothetical protein
MAARRDAQGAGYAAGRRLRPVAEEIGRVLDDGIQQRLVSTRLSRQDEIASVASGPGSERVSRVSDRGSFSLRGVCPRTVGASWFSNQEVLR